ncbi:hypothetical protein ZEAMMB73_Zm00001d027470 [Zea mays]|uniref:Uncharacterized protein n=1 Tax=Zea mays TaxID=4577 RepID=A0A1D6JMC9_MAIZE|nr:hypothetical protein ZEAMMB73_Zm00001d027470 [Zea mays]
MTHETDDLKGIYPYYSLREFCRRPHIRFCLHPDLALSLSTTQHQAPCPPAISAAPNRGIRLRYGRRSPLLRPNSRLASSSASWLSVLRPRCPWKEIENHGPRPGSKWMEIEESASAAPWHPLRPPPLPHLPARETIAIVPLPRAARDDPLPRDSRVFATHGVSLCADLLLHLDLSEKIINLYWSVYCAEGIGTSSGSQEWKANLSWVLAALAPRRSSSGCFMLVHLRRPTSRINIILDEIHFSVFSALFSLILTNSGQTTIAVLASKNIVSPVRRIPVGGLSYGTDDHSLRDEFAKYGEVVEGIKLIAALGGLLKNGLSYGTDDHSLRVEFAKYGEVVEGTLFIVALALALLFADQLCFNLSN